MRTVRKAEGARMNNEKDTIDSHEIENLNLTKEYHPHVVLQPPK